MSEELSIERREAILAALAHLLLGVLHRPQGDRRLPAQRDDGVGSSSVTAAVRDQRQRGLDRPAAPRPAPQGDADPPPATRSHDQLRVGQLSVVARSSRHASICSMAVGQVSWAALVRSAAEGVQHEAAVDEPGADDLLRAHADDARHVLHGLGAHESLAHRAEPGLQCRQLLVLADESSEAGDHQGGERDEADGGQQHQRQLASSSIAAHSIRTRRGQQRQCEHGRPVDG